MRSEYRTARCFVFSEKMNLQGLLASAAINIGLALTTLTIFSVLKKQPSNASIYYARRLSMRQYIHFDSFNLKRCLPSISWIVRAIHVSENEILETSGLDALVVVRLFKFGIKFFFVSSIPGMMVLLPVNCGDQEGRSENNYYTMDAFTISNISTGSNRLWVHFVCLWFISFYGLYLLYKEYNDILLMRIREIRYNRQRPDQFTVLVHEIPICTEHKAHGCSVDHFFLKYHPYNYHSHQIMYDTKDIKKLMNQAKNMSRKIEELSESTPLKKKKWKFPFFGSLQGDNRKVPVLEEKLRALSKTIFQLQNKEMLIEKELPAAFVIFKSRSGALLAAQSQQHKHPLIWITEMAPEPRDLSWRNLGLSQRTLPLRKTGIILAASLLTIFFAIPVTAVQGIAKYEKLKKWFPPIQAIGLIPGLSSVVSGYLPSVILKGFLYVVPFAMLGMAKLAGCIAKSKEEIKACNMVFYFLVGNVFFLSLLSGSLLEEIGESVSHPRKIPTHLARAVSAQAEFFMTYILTDALSGFSLEILQPGLLVWDAIKSCIHGRGTERSPYLFSLPYFRIVPLVSLSILIGMVYAVVAPLLLPFIIGYFCVGYVVYINQIEDVYETTYESFGQYWPYIHHYILVAVILMQIVMMGLFGLKSKPSASISTIPLLLLTFMFNGYCKMRFLPTFQNGNLQDAAENDALDEKNGTLELNSDNAINAYCPPGLRPLNFITTESSSTPLISNQSW